MERIVTADCNLDEMVDLHALNRPFGGPAGRDMAGKVATLPLRDALALVVEGWSDDKFRQLSAVILRPSGAAIRSFEEMRDLYARAEGVPAS
jgi:hypothetical protein